ncbi:MAG: hypothetical protein AB1698_16140 [Pseudomonadota bacterium]
MSRPVVYRVTTSDQADQWFAELPDATDAAQQIVADGKGVSVVHVPVPQTPEAFLAFVRSFRPVGTGLTLEQVENVRRHFLGCSQNEAVR